MSQTPNSRVEYDYIVTILFGFWVILGTLGKNVYTREAYGDTFNTMSWHKFKEECISKELVTLEWIQVISGVACVYCFNIPVNDIIELAVKG